MSPPWSREGRFLSRARRAISRAYYGVFHQAREFLERSGVFFVGQNPHRELAVLLTNTGDVGVDEAAQLLADLRLQRKVADYDVTDARIEDEALATPCVPP